MSPWVDKLKHMTHGQWDARPMVTFPATGHRCPLTDTELYCLVTETHVCEQLAQCCYLKLQGLESNLRPFVQTKNSRQSKQGQWWWWVESYPHTHTRLTALFQGLPGWAGTRKVKPIRIFLKQETVSSSGMSWAICKSASRSKQITRQHPTTQFFTGRMPFLPPNQQRQSTEGHWRLVESLALIFFF